MKETLEFLTNQLISNTTETKIVELLRFLRSSNLYNICITIGSYFSPLFPHCKEIIDECAICYYFTNNHDLAYDFHEKSLSLLGLDEKTSWFILFNQHFSINNVADRYIYYNSQKVEEILKRPKKPFPLVTLTITTCKRFDLFEKTINSLINCVDIDMIDFWFCVDDNSSEEDRTKMKNLYPFFKFYFKDISEKGHPQSMNIIRNNISTPYFFHLEDDWKFFVKRNYIADAIDVLEANKSIGQCLLNKNYAEIESDIDIKGGIFKQTNRGFRYFIHEYCRTEEELNNWKTKYGNCKSSFYWPHWSLRPSLQRSSIIKELGEFNETISHFEMDYAHRYTNKGYISAFFEGIYCLHIGRLTSERDDETKLNAYKLNDEIQFYGKENKKSLLKLRTLVVNLDRRPDRWEAFKENAKDLEFLNYEKFSAIDGSILKNSSQLQQIFENNDYHMRKGMVGCLLSHVKLYTDLINSDFDAFIILEDDIEITPNFKTKFEHVISQLTDKEWDIVFLGHHVRDKDKQSDELVKDKHPTLFKRDTYWSFLNSLGGTGGYIISREGASKFLDFIDKTGSTNGIDTLIQKSANDLNIYYPTPHLIFSECYRGDNQNLDTDIQFDYSKDLVLTLEQRLALEIDFYKDNISKIENYDEALHLCSAENLEKPFYYANDTEENITNIAAKSIYKFYTLENKIIFVVPNHESVQRYFHRFKKFEKYNIDDALVFQEK